MTYSLRSLAFAASLMLSQTFSFKPLQAATLQQNKVVASYYTEWSVYGRNFPVSQIPAEKLTHVIYGFIAICGPNESLREANSAGYSALVNECQDQDDYTVTVHDRWAALDKAYPGDSWDTPIKGNFGELARLKNRNPQLKILPSIGGWTLSDPYFYLAKDDQYRKRFLISIQFLKTYPMFDGLDIDWEYPGGGGASTTLGDPSEGQHYATLMADLRSALDRLQTETGRRYELTSAVGADPKKIQAVNYQAAAEHLDYIFAMTYDFYGAWNGVLGHQAGLFAGESSKIAGFTGSDAISNLLNAGVPKDKLVLGYAMYGRGWQGVTGANEIKPMDGTGGAPIAGTWEAGVLDYKDIANRFFDEGTSQGKNGFLYYYDDKAEAPYLYNPARGELISFEDARSVRAKVKFAEDLGLAGLFSWEIDADNGTLLGQLR